MGNTKEYREANKEKRKAYKKEYDRKNREKNKKYYQDNKPEILAQQKVYDEKNKEKIKEYQKEYQKEYSKKYSKKYYQDHKEDILKKRKAYREKMKKALIVLAMCLIGGSAFASPWYETHNVEAFVKRGKPIREGLLSGDRKLNGNITLLGIGFTPLPEKSWLTLETQGGWWQNKGKINDSEDSRDMLGNRKSIPREGAIFSIVPVFRLELPYAYFKGGFGIAVITEPDDVTLSGHLQFIDEAGFGLIRNNLRAGISYLHISNADIKKPNAGRNYLNFEIAYRF